MRTSQGISGLILDEPLLWERGKKGRSGFSMPRRDVVPSPVDEGLTGDGVSERASFIAVIFPAIGMYISETAFTDSSVPNSSPFSKVSPISGSSTKTISPN